MSALNATVYSSSRVAFAMGRDRNFPGIFSKVNSKNYTPHWAILISLVIVVLMAVSLPIEHVASAADVMFLLLFLQVNIAMIRLRKKRPDLDRGYFTPLFPWLSIIGIASLLFLAIYMFKYSPIAWIVTACWVGLGLLTYRGYASKREVEHIRKVEALERIERKEYGILTCLSNPKSISSLTNIAIAIAKRHQGRIIFLHVIEVREGQKLMAGWEESARARPMLEEAESLAMEAGIPTRSIIEVSHRVSEGIVNTAVEEGCNFILIGRQKQPTFLDRVFSSLIDTVLQKSPSEVAVLHGDYDAGKVHDIIIPFGADIHTRLATEIAPALMSHFGAKLRIAIVVDPDISPEDRDKKIAEIKQLMDDNSLTAKIDVVVKKDILRGIVDKSKRADLMLMGGRTGDFLELLLAKSLAQEITEQSKCPVLWLKEYEERESFWISLLKPLQEAGEKHA
jgi:nucleotide-binding universal stress UspA family protein